jgi:hypothetical protein
LLLLALKNKCYDLSFLEVNVIKVYVSVKQAGKRKEYIKSKELILKSIPHSLRELITEVVHLNVAEYNNKAVDPLILHYLSPDVIDNQATTGKVGFGERRSHKQADVERAIETALLAFEDGIYRVFIGEDEVLSLNQPITLKEGALLTFIRLTMLAGRMW